MRISDWSSDGCSSDLRATLVYSRLVGGALLEAVHPGVQVPEPRPIRPDCGQLADETQLHIGRGERIAHQVVVSRQALVDVAQVVVQFGIDLRSEEHTSELQSLMRISYAVFCLNKKKKQRQQ